MKGAFTELEISGKEVNQTYEFDSLVKDITDSELGSPAKLKPKQKKNFRVIIDELCKQKPQG